MQQDDDRGKHIAGTVGYTNTQWLQIDEVAAPDVIKKACRRLAIKYHPDKAVSHPVCKQTAESLSKKVNEAHQVLCDPKKKLEYPRARRRTVGNLDGQDQKVRRRRVTPPPAGSENSQEARDDKE